ncbi:Uncharacterized protein TPAR_01181, partial [Tolypocladium paradoxum]
MPNPPAPPLPPGPYPVTVNGLHGLDMKLWTDDGRYGTLENLPPNTEHFASLAVAVNIGLEMAETPRGRQALTELGRKVANYRAYTAFPFAGNVADMQGHVNHFLRCVRADYPSIVIGSGALTNPDQLAATNKFNWWRGSFQAFDPKIAGIFSYNASVRNFALPGQQWQPAKVTALTTWSKRVNDMVAAHHAYCRAIAHSSAAMKYRKRWRNFLFMFACATLHELSHFFVGYLTRGALPDTPEGITHLNYSSYFDEESGDWHPGGESGRWLENVLYGGSIEYYADRGDDRGQAGIPHLLDAQAIAYEIEPDTIDHFVMDPRSTSLPVSLTFLGAWLIVSKQFTYFPFPFYQTVFLGKRDFFEGSSALEEALREPAEAAKHRPSFDGWRQLGAPQPILSESKIFGDGREIL